MTYLTIKSPYSLSEFKLVCLVTIHIHIHIHIYSAYPHILYFYHKCQFITIDHIKCVTCCEIIVFTQPYSVTSHATIVTILLTLFIIHFSENYKSRILQKTPTQSQETKSLNYEEDEKSNSDSKSKVRTSRVICTIEEAISRIVN